MRFSYLTETIYFFLHTIYYPVIFTLNSSALQATTALKGKLCTNIKVLCNIPAYFTDLYLINFSYSIHYPSDMKWGSQDENGTWNGLVMEAAKKVASFKNKNAFQ